VVVRKMQSRLMSSHGIRLALGSLALCFASSAGATAEKQVSLLSGILFDARGERMTPTHATKNNTRYRYYVSRSLLAGTVKHSGQRIPAVSLEALVRKKRSSSNSAATDSVGRQTRSLFCVRLSQQELGIRGGDARTTKPPRRDNCWCTARICGPNRLCAIGSMNTEIKRPGDTGTTRASAKSEIGTRPIT